MWCYVLVICWTGGRCGSTSVLLTYSEVVVLQAKLIGSKRKGTTNELNWTGNLGKRINFLKRPEQERNTKSVYELNGYYIGIIIISNCALDIWLLCKEQKQNAASIKKNNI